MTIQKILLADDDEQYKQSLKRALFGDYDVDFASNADEEIKKARENTYSLIITDNKMNDGYRNSGIYAIQEIRRFDTKTPIIFHSSNTSVDLSFIALSKGANEVIPKTLSLSKLRESIKKYLE